MQAAKLPKWTLSICWGRPAVLQSVGSQWTNLEWLVQYLLVRRLREVRRSAGRGGGLSGLTGLTCRWTNTQRLHSAVMTSSEMDLTLRVGLSCTIPAGIHQSWRLAAFFFSLFLYRDARLLEGLEKNLASFYVISHQQIRRTISRLKKNIQPNLLILSQPAKPPHPCAEVMRNKTASVEDSWQRWSCNAAMACS